MTHQAFREAEGDFQVWLNALNAASESYLPQAGKLLEGIGPKPMGGSRERDAKLVLGNISERIDDVMISFDKVLRSIGMSARYERYFKG